MILTRRAPRDLDYAIAHFRLAVKPYEGHSPVDIGRILVDILKPVALRDPDRALESGRARAPGV